MIVVLLYVIKGLWGQGIIEHVHIKTEKDFYIYSVLNRTTNEHLFYGVRTYFNYKLFYGHCKYYHLDMRTYNYKFYKGALFYPFYTIVFSDLRGKLLNIELHHISIIGPSIVCHSTKGYMRHFKTITLWDGIGYYRTNQKILLKGEIIVYDYRLHYIYAHHINIAIEKDIFISADKALIYIDTISNKVVACTLIGHICYIKKSDKKSMHASHAYYNSTKYPHKIILKNTHIRKKDYRFKTNEVYLDMRCL